MSRFPARERVNRESTGFQSAQRVSDVEEVTRGTLGEIYIAPANRFKMVVAGTGAFGATGFGTSGALSPEPR